MKNELTVLKSVRHCKLIAKKLDEECKKLALNSFCACNKSGGTLAEFQAVANVVFKRDLTELYFETVKQAVADVPKSFRALLYAVYVKKTSKVELCKRYGTSLATIYRKLEEARKLFAKSLVSVGAEEEWFVKVFNALQKFYTVLQKSCFDDAYATYVKQLD